ncbi:SET domain-containing protein, partial [Neolentinus lepideus HHB14362 ss-1]
STSMSTLYEIRPTSYGGRGAFAISSIPAGTVVHSSPSPFAHVVYRVFRKEVCAWCWRYAWDDAGRGNWPVKINDAGKGKERDKARGGLWFCSESCKEEWTKDDEDAFAVGVYETIDREAAKALKVKPTTDLDPSENKRIVLSLSDIVPESLQANDLTAEFMDSVWTEAEQVAHSSFISSTASGRSQGKRRALTLLSDSSVSTSWSEFLSLQPSELSAVRSSPRQLSQWIQVYLFLASIFAGHPLHPLTLDPSYIRAIFIRDAGNSFGIWQLPYMDESEMFGWGVWVSASYFNHSCSPSLIKQRTGREFSFMTTRLIEAGEELTISYGSVSDDMKTRRKRLWDGWWFWCGCTRCVEDLRTSDEHGDDVSNIPLR